MNFDWSPARKPQKDYVRQYALEDVGQRDRSLWLPGGQCLDVAKARDFMGVLNQGSRLIVVERDKAVYRRMLKCLSRWTWDVPPLPFNGHLHELALPYPLDFVFLDFCGTIDKLSLHWLHNSLARNLNEGAIVCATQSYGWRHNETMRKFVINLRTGWPRLYEGFSKDKRIKDEYLLLPLMIFKCVFNRFVFTIRSPVKYQDHRRSMVLYRLEAFSPIIGGTNGWPSVEEVVHYAVGNFSDGSHPSINARKAGQTRRMMTKKTPKKEFSTRRAETDLPPVEPMMVHDKGDPPKKRSAKIEAKDVIDAIFFKKQEGESLLRKYLKQQKAKGLPEKRVAAAIKAHVTRRKLAQTQK